MNHSDAKWLGDDGSEIVVKAYELITGDRNNDYGHPADDYSKVAEIFEALTGIHLTVQQALCFPLAMKLARMRTSRERGLWHEDSVVDAIGYIGCMSMAKRRGHT